mmetsp:Transcript_8540/g.20888  ORF Transcript_8540/g.20888 Transcript_8540/m.20888 type:complete len:452 (-) Transcript_8540:50-1405(-)
MNEMAGETGDTSSASTPLMQDDITPVGKKDSADSTTKGLSFWNIFITQVVFDTSGAIVTIPTAIGQLGYVLGPIALILWCLLAYCMNCFLLDVMMSAPNRRCKNFGDVGAEIAGKRGRNLFRFIQMLNLVLFLPTLMSLQAESWQYVFNDPWKCSGYWTLIVFGGLLIMLSFLRRWRETALIAIISLGLSIVKSSILLPYSYVEYQHDVLVSDSYLGQASAFGAPSGGNQWYLVAQALSLICYSYTPVFILAETMAVADDPVCYKKALGWATIVQILLYLVPGIMGAVMWGYSIESPVTLEIPHDAIGILLNVFVAIASCIDYIIASLVVTEFTRLLMANSKYAFMQRVSKYHILTVLPGIVFALLVVLLFRNFGNLVGILSGLTIVGTNTYIISICWLLGGRKVVVGQKSWPLYTALALGIPLTIFIIAGSIHGLTDANSSSGEDFFCGS